MIEPIVAAYAAGVVDSDGCIHIDQRKRKGPDSYITRTSVTQTHEQIPMWFQRNFGGALCTMNTRCDGKWEKIPIYRWTISCQQAAKFLQIILPFLVLKQEQAKLCIKLSETFIPRSTKRPSDKMLNYRNNLYRNMRNLNARGNKRIQLQCNSSKGE